MTYIPVDLHRLILARSGGCCEYCRIHRSDSTAVYHVEHIIAISHGGQTVENNLAFSCARCKLYKGPNIAAADPNTGEPTFLFHPRRHNWHEHFQLDGVMLQSLTPEGRATVFVLHLNEPNRLTRRELLIPLGRYPCPELEA